MNVVASVSVWAFVGLCVLLMIFIVTLVVLVAKRPGVAVKVGLFKGAIDIRNDIGSNAPVEGGAASTLKPIEKKRPKPSPK